MKVTAYLRVSTDKQVEHGYGLDVQRAAISAWAKTTGRKVVQWRVDEGVCGANGLENREALPLALGDLQDGTAGGLVVFKLDRLARDLIIQETLIAEVRKAGGEIFTTAAGEAGYLADDPDDPSRKLIRQVLGAVNEYERAMIVLRMKAGRRIKASRGGYAGFGSPAFGQRSIDKELVADEAEQAAVARILELRGEGLSLREIIARLDAEGIRAKRGGGWSPSTVSRVLARAGRQ